MWSTQHSFNLLICSITCPSVGCHGVRLSRSGTWKPLSWQGYGRRIRNSVNPAMPQGFSIRYVVLISGIWLPHIPTLYSLCHPEFVLLLSHPCSTLRPESKHPAPAGCSSTAWDSREMQEIEKFVDTEWMPLSLMLRLLPQDVGVMRGERERK